MQRPTVATFAGSVGKGLLAGLVGTAVMTVSSTIEQKLRERGASSAPADAASEVYGTEQVMLPALDGAPPATEWGAEEVAIDAWHHLVYGLATGAAYELLDGRRP